MVIIMLDTYDKIYMILNNLLLITLLCLIKNHEFQIKKSFYSFVKIRIFGQSTN